MSVPSIMSLHNRLSGYTMEILEDTLESGGRKLKKIDHEMKYLDEPTREYVMKNVIRFKKACKAADFKRDEYR